MSNITVKISFIHENHEELNGLYFHLRGRHVVDTMTITRQGRFIRSKPIFFLLMTGFGVYFLRLC